MKKDKYDSFPKEDRQRLESNKALSVKDIEIKDPNNPAKQLDSKLIAFNEK